MSASSQNTNTRDSPLEELESGTLVARSAFSLTVHFIFSRCCGRMLTLPMLPSLVADEVSAGLVIPLGWDEEKGELWAETSRGPCNVCLGNLWRSLGDVATNETSCIAGGAGLSHGEMSDHGG